jgi:hypothetical protein
MREGTRASDEEERRCEERRKSLISQARGSSMEDVQPERRVWEERIRGDDPDTLLQPELQARRGGRVCA